MIQTLSTVMQLFEGCIFQFGCCFNTFDLIRLSRTVQRTYFIIYEFCFACFKVEYKRSYIFQSSSNETIIELQIWTLILEYAAYKLSFQKFESQGEYCQSCKQAFSLGYKVQQTFFVPGKKKLGEQHETSLLLKSHYSY